ncbi:MAG: helix-turn-helix transcriptional regulator [Lachnospiraceae bacterium]|nr:helix-turn-helix transcriptional regulator [Lachnospiraceae bacterium]
MRTATDFCVDLVALDEITRRAGCKTYTEIADRLEMNRNTVANVMTGKEKPSALFMMRFVEAFDVEAGRAGHIFFKRNLRSA